MAGHRPWPVSRLAQSTDRALAPRPHGSLLWERQGFLIFLMRGERQKRKMESLRRVRLFVTLWTVARQAPLSMRFSKQGCWSGVPFPSPGDLPNPGIEPRPPTLQADALPSAPPGK